MTGPMSIQDLKVARLPRAEHWGPYSDAEMLRENLEDLIRHVGKAIEGCDCRTCKRYVSVKAMLLRCFKP